ncbi:hypothetical protein ACN6LA_005612, partial [Streptomyces sp. SAS_269]
MIFGRSERGKPPVEPVTLKILVAGGFGVGLDRSTIAEVISRLGRRGLLDKVRDPQDGRRF